MTGETIVGTSTEELEAMTDEQLLAWVTPLLPVTRPKEGAGTSEEAAPAKKKRTRASSNTAFTPEMQDMLAQALAVLEERKKKQV